MKKILSVLCVLVVAFMLTACGSKTGTYKLVSMESAEMKLTAEDLEKYGMTMELIIKDDKNAVLKAAGEEKQLTYDDKNFTGKNEETGEDESIPYTLEGNTLTLTQDGEKMVFKK